jgi:hypothetical protein
LGAAMVDESVEIAMSSASGGSRIRGVAFTTTDRAERRCKRGKEGKGDSP